MLDEARKLEALEEELRRDLDAISRVRRMMAFKGGSAPAASVPPETQATTTMLPVSDYDDDDSVPVASLRGTIEKLINESPAEKWTTQKVLSYLRSTGYPLRAQKPIYSVGQSLQVLAATGRIRLTRKGTGSAPNIYRAIAKAEPSEQINIDLAANGSEN